MDDIIIVVIVIVALTFSLVKHIKRNREELEESEGNPWMHLPKDLNPEVRTVNTSPPARENYTPPPRKREVARTESNTPPPPPEQQEEEQEFDINSPEEVRRGIIWTEILNRKY